MYYCYQHNWSSRYEQCPSCVTYKTTASNNTIEVTMPFQPKSVHELEAKLAAARIEIDKLEARCKELEAELSTTASNAMLAGKLEMQKITELESENRILKAQLEKCKEQRNKALLSYNYHQVKASSEEILQFIKEDNEELASIE